MKEEVSFRTVGEKGDLVGRVVNELQRLILEGALQPGKQLPPERELTRQLGVSRTVLREATRTLVAKGLLESKPGVGTIVHQVTWEQVVEPLFLLMQTNKASISLDHLHQVRSVLEVEIASLAASQAKQGEVDDLHRVLADMEAAEDSPAQFADHDAEFHRLLAETTHNPLFSILLDSIRDLMKEVRLMVASYPDLYPQVMFDHRLILEKVSAGDAVGAKKAMVEHLEHARGFQQRLAKDQTRGRTPLAVEASRQREGDADA